MVSNVITAAATLLAVAVGWFLKRKSDISQWRRELYVELLLLVDEFSEGRRGVELPPDWLDRTRRAFANVDLLDNEVVRVAALDVYGVIKEAVRSGGKFDRSYDENDLRRKWAHLVGVMRSDLPSRGRWRLHRATRKMLARFPLEGQKPVLAAENRDGCRPTV
jgi:hypothetical protein